MEPPSSTMKPTKSPYNLTSSNLLEKMKAFSRRIKNENNQSTISSFHQFYVLFKLMLLKIIRNRVALWIQLFHHMICGLTFGKFNFNLKHNWKKYMIS